MQNDFPNIRYLQVTHIPFAQADDGTVITDELWANDLKAIANSVGPLRVAAPQFPKDSKQNTWGPTAAHIPPSSNISFIGFPPMRSWRDFWRMYQIRRILHREVSAADLVHTSNMFPPYLGLSYAHDLAVSLNKKTIFAIAEDFADMIGWEWQRLAKSAWDRWYREKIVHWMENRARQSARTASLTFLFTPPAVSLFRLDTANGIAVRDTTHTAQDVINASDLKAKCQEIATGAPLHIIAACRHKPLKGLDFLVIAMAELKKRGIPVKATLYGHGPMTQELKHIAARLNVADNVLFPGQLSPGPELYGAIAKAHIFAMPHRTNDFARAFYDAMTGGTPVVAFQTPSSSGTIRQNVDGMIVPLDNAVALSLAIEYLHNNRQLLADMSQSSRSRALVETQSAWHQYRAERIRELFDDITTVTNELT